MAARFEVASALREIGTILAALGENRFRARAYARGARAVEGLDDETLAALVATGRLTDVEGIGVALAGVIGDLVSTGRSELLERLRRQVPASVLELASLRGLSLERARALHDALGVSTLDELEAACRGGRVREVEGFGEKTEARLLDAIAWHRAASAQQRLIDLLGPAGELLEHVRRARGVHDAELAGAVRRFEEAAGELVVVACARAARSTLDALSALRQVARVERREDDRVRVRLGTGLPVTLIVAPPELWGAALGLATAGPEHLAALAALAADRDLALDERGLVRARSRTRVPTTTEAELYGLLGLPLLPPEVRDDGASVLAATHGDDFADLISEGDLKGAVHCHTDWSDGVDTVEAMARAAQAMGFAYLTITDHSQAAHYAGGLTPERLRAQAQEIARVQAQVKVRLLRGTECDILGDGALDFDDEDLRALDVVIASVHARQRLDEDAMTRRLVHALERPLFKIWGHPLGRLVLRRAPVACRLDEVLDAAARSPAAIEVNADPYRLDLPPHGLRAARARGLRFVISLDAHSTGGLDVLPFGVGIARRGWVRRHEVLNALPVDAFIAAVAPRRAG